MMQMFVSMDRFQEPYESEGEYECCEDCGEELDEDDVYDVEGEFVCECCLKIRFKYSA